MLNINRKINKANKYYGVLPVPENRNIVMLIFITPILNKIETKFKQYWEGKLLSFTSVLNIKKRHVAPKIIC